MTDDDTTASADESRRKLRAAGLRATASRIAVLQYLESRTAPVSHQEVCRALSGRGFDNSTIFRVLNEASDAGLFVRLELGDHLWRYERSAAVEPGLPATTRHPHFLCVDCGTILCLARSALNGAFEKPLDSDAIGSVTEILVKGRCRDCRLSLPQCPEAR